MPGFPLAASAGLLALASLSGLLRAAGVDLLDWLPLFPGCAFRALSGWPCPGCGMTRALLLAGQLRLPEAFAANPLLAVVPAALLLSGRPPSATRTRAGAALLALVLAVWLARVL